MKIGTRSSTMAMAQTNDIIDRLRRADPNLAPEAFQFKPSGDVDQVSKLNRHGGKGGAFVAELRAAMLAGEVACAMHSLKDMPGDEETPGLVIAAMLPREPSEDALVMRPGLSFEDAQKSGFAGLKIGTNAVRRAAFLKRLYPDAEVIHYRGAGDTRLQKLDGGALQKLPDGGAVGPADALVMARAGLVRIGHANRIAHVFPMDAMLPSVGQGVIAVECPTTHWATRESLSAINDPQTCAVADAEREMLWILNGHCNAPIAGHAILDRATLSLTGMVTSLDGRSVITAKGDGPADRPRELGRRIGLALIEKGAAALIQDSRDDAAPMV